MDQVIDFFKNLGDVSDWPPRWHCGRWTDFHGWLYIISDLLIWSAYFAIPIFIIYFISKRREYRFIKLYFLFAAFILACGSTHLMDAIIFWWPAYRVSALIRFITGVISWVTVFYLIKILPQAFSLKSPKLLEDEINKREAVENDLKLKIKQLYEAEKLGNFGHFEMDLKNGTVQWSEGMGLLFDVEDVSTIKTFEDYTQFLPEGERQVAQNFLKESPGRNDFGPYYQKVKTAKGSNRILYIKGKVNRENGIATRINGTAQDVTEIRRNKEQLEDSKQLFKNAFLYSSLGMALVSLDGEVIDFNQATCRILGYGEEEFRRINFFELIHPDERADSLKNMQQLLSKEKELFQNEKRLIKKDGEMIWTLFSQIIVWKEQEPSYYIFQIADITENKNLFNEIKEQNRELEIYISNTNEFNRIISHNLKGPAGSLVQLADFIEHSESEEDKVFLNSKIKETAGLIITTLEDLKSFIEIKLGSQDAVFSSVNEALKYTYKLLEEKIAGIDPSITLKIDVDTIRFPKVYTESIIYNLLSNSLKYHNKNKKPEIYISTFAEKDEIVLVVSDNGIGIDLEKYGTEMFKYKKVFHRGYDSYGMGLFLVKTQVEAYGGKVKVESEINNGTTFTIRLKK